MKGIKEKLLKSVVKAAEKTVNADGGWGDGWPPCIGYVYQPKRPKKK